MPGDQRKTWRVIDLIKWGTDYFESKSISNSRREVEWLLCHTLNCKRIDLYLQFEQPLFGKELRSFKSMVLRRVKGEPFQHIIGKAPFYGRDFSTNTNALIPRPETETIIDILKDKGKQFESVLEIGTGSGCIAITLILEGIGKNIIATDISSKALGVARSNAEKFQTKEVSFRCHDFLKDTINSTFDLIVSNPPYIGFNEMSNLDKTVRDYDPDIALTDKADGYTFYRHFAENARSMLNPGGFMLLEFGGEPQREIIESIFTSQNYKICVYDDLENTPRIIKVTPL